MSALMQIGSSKAWGRERIAWIGLTLALMVLLAPTLHMLATTVWDNDDQAHGPIIGAVSLWLMWRNRAAVLSQPYRPATGWGGAVFLVAAASYVLGRSQDIAQLEVLSLILMAAGLLLLLRGPLALRAWAFPLAFLVFMVPLPGVFVQAITIPLKSAVSVVVESAMHAVGFPVARSGVILYIGPYQLLVADACSGLNSMFTLEALGLLYVNLMGYQSRARNALLALLIIPISFFANVVRVIILVLVTFYLGDAAGQGFVHSFAGMVLFIVGLLTMFAVDVMLGRFLGPGRGRGE